MIDVIKALKGERDMPVNMNICVKSLAFITAAVMILAGFTACSDKTSAGFSQAASQSDTEKSAFEMLSKLKSSDGSENLDSAAYFDDELFKSNCAKLYSIEYEELSDGGLLFCGSGEYADEVSMLKPESGDVFEAVKAFEARKNQRIKTYQGYAPKEVDKIEKAVIFEYGGFAVMIISDNAEQLKATLCGD